MNGIEGAAVLHAQSGQRVDVETSPVVDLAAGKSPMRESIMLALEQAMQRENRPGSLSRSISPRPAVDHVLAVDDRREFGFEGWRLVTRGIMRTAIPRRQLEQFAACRLLARAGVYDDRSEERRVGKECRARWSASRLKKRSDKWIGGGCRLAMY